MINYIQLSGITSMRFDCIPTGLPLAGYVNMNQLAHLALQHQGLGQQDKKDGVEAGAGYAVTLPRDCDSGDGSGSIIDFRSHPDLRLQQILASAGQSTMYSSAHHTELPHGTCGKLFVVSYVLLCVII